MNNPLLFAYLFDAKGSGNFILDSDINRILMSNEFSWFHVDANNKTQALNFFHHSITNIDPFIINAILDEETRPRMEKINDDALIILREVNLNDNAIPEDMVSIRIWVNNNRIITTCLRQLKAVNDIQQKIKEGKGPKNTGDFIYMLTDFLFSNMEPSLRKLDDETDVIEEKILENFSYTTLREDIVAIRKQAIKFRRYMAPQRDAISSLCLSDFTWLNKTHIRHLKESYNRITRYVEDLDAIRERAQIVQDELVNTLSDKINKNMYLLSLIAGIFLPLGFLTGLLGINIAGIPGADNPNAFLIFSFILLVLVSLQIWVFKRLGWF